MKKFKGSVSVLLCIAMLLSMSAIFASAVDAYPESEHNYQNNYYNEWTYQYPENADGLFVTFSSDTFVESGSSLSVSVNELVAKENLQQPVMNSLSQKTGDFISIFDGNGNLIDVYQGRELSGKTLYIPTSSFKITLTTDDSDTGYGFKITRISSEPLDGTSVLVFHIGDTKKAVFLKNRYSYSFPAEYGEIFNLLSVIGWKFGNDEFYYSVSDSTYTCRTNAINWLTPYITTGSYIYKTGKHDIYAITTPVVLSPEEVYNFTNSSRYFENYEDGYYMTKHDYIRLISMTAANSATSPLLLLPGAITDIVLMFYPKFEWNGSCIGFATTACLQHNGLIDIVSTQEGAKCIRDLQPTDEIVSALNYYNAQAAEGILAKNKAFSADKKEFSRQLRKLYKTAENGNLVLLEFSPNGFPKELGYHGIAVTGAYTDPDGNHILLVYNENYSDYASGRAHKICINPDFTKLETDEYGDDLMCFFWTDTFDGYTSFELFKDSYNPIPWRIDIIRHIFEFLIDWFKYIFGKVDY